MGLAGLVEKDTKTHAARRVALDGGDFVITADDEDPVRSVHAITEARQRRATPLSPATRRHAPRR